MSNFHRRISFATQADKKTTSKMSIKKSFIFDVILSGVN